MSSLFFVLMATLCGAVYTYILRRNSDSPADAQKFVFWAFVFSFLSSLLFAGSSLRIVSWPLLGLAALSGIFVTLIFYSLPRAFESGPANLSVGIFQAACIIPPLLMFSVFGCECDFDYTFFHALGALLVIAGFLKSALFTKGLKLSLKWAFYTGLAFASQTVALTIYQYQALLTKPALPEHSLLLPVSSIEAATGWFLPVLFSVVILWNFISLKGKIWQRKKVVRDGALGGLFNTGATAFFMLALALATPKLTTLIVPINAVFTIIFCGIWSQWLYKERVDWIGMSIALAGILISFV